MKRSLMGLQGWDNAKPTDIVYSNAGKLLYIPYLKYTISMGKAIGVIYMKTVNTCRIMALYSSSLMATDYGNVLIIGNITTTTSSSIATKDYNGQSNTAQMVGQRGSNCATAYYCNQYATDGTNKGDWYLPALGEYLEVASNKSVFSSAFSKAGGSVPDDWHVSSTQYSNIRMWALNFAGTHTDNTRKDLADNRVRPSLIINY